MGGLPQGRLWRRQPGFRQPTACHPMCPSCGHRTVISTPQKVNKPKKTTHLSYNVTFRSIPQKFYSLLFQIILEIQSRHYYRARTQGNIGRMASVHYSKNIWYNTIVPPQIPPRNCPTFIFDFSHWITRLESLEFPHETVPLIYVPVTQSSYIVKSSSHFEMYGECSHGMEH